MTFQQSEDLVLHSRSQKSCMNICCVTFHTMTYNQWQCKVQNLQLLIIKISLIMYDFS